MRYETDPKPKADNPLEHAFTAEDENPLLCAWLSPAAREAFASVPSKAETLVLGEEKERKRWGKPEGSADERAARIEAQREKTEATYQKIQTGIEELATSLAQGKSEPLLALLDAVSRFHRYSWGNTLLIALQQPEATLVAGFTTWKELGRFVKAGEKGILILAPIPKRVTRVVQAEDESGEGEEVKTTQTVSGSGVWGFKVVFVFDVSQTDGKPLPEIAAYLGDPAHSLSRLKDQVREAGITLTYREDLGGSYGRSLVGTIEMRSGLPPAQEFGTLVHEFAHELLHPRQERAQIPKHVKEMEAEAVAYVVSRAVGLEPGTASRDYIQLYQGNAELLAASLDRIQKTAALILAGLETTG